MKEKESDIEEDKSDIKINMNNNNINNYELFDKITKQINEDIIKNKNFIKSDDSELFNAVKNFFLKLYSEKNNLLEIKNKFGNNLSQYYLSSGQIFLSLEIIKIYYNIYINEIDGKTNFINWLNNNNSNEQNIFEIGIEIQSNPKDIIEFYKQIFEIIEKLNNNYIVYQILEKRKENVFILTIKEEKLYLLLFLYEKIKKYYPSSNPLDIKNKSCLTPLHFSSYYSNREITDILLILGCKINPEDNHLNIPLHFAIKGGDLSVVKKLIFYGADKNKLNKDKLTPSDYAKKYGNSAMINLFSKNPLNNIEALNNKKYDKLFLLIFLGLIAIKYGIYKYFWKSYISDGICLISFLYLVLRPKNYYIFSYENNNKEPEDIGFEELFLQCNYDKNKMKKICPKCKIIKKFKTKHCIICDTCVEDFDHHCYWINKCINSKIFYEFIAFLIIMFTFLLINLISFFIEFKRIVKINKNKNYSYYIGLVILTIYLFIISFGIAIVSSLLYERFIETISSKKKMTLEENLLNKKNSEDEGDKINIINNSEDKI